MARTGDLHGKVKWTSVDSVETDLSPLAADDVRNEEEEEYDVSANHSTLTAGGVHVRSSRGTGQPSSVGRCLILVVLLLLISFLVVTVLSIAFVRLTTRVLSLPQLVPSVSCTDICRWPWQSTSNASDDSSATHLSAADNRERVYGVYHQHQFDEFICPSNFRNLADYNLAFPLSAHQQFAYDEAPHLTIPPFDSILPRCLAPASIIYSQTQPCNNGQPPANPADPPCDAQLPCTLLFYTNTSHLHTPIILITGQSDYSSQSFCGLALDYTHNTSNSNLLHWYAQNNDMAEHAQLSGIPIGINCFDMARAIRRVLTERWMLGRVAQCYGETRRELVRTWVADGTLQLVDGYMIQLDEMKRASGDMNRISVLHALLGLGSYVRSDAFALAISDITRHWSGPLTSENATILATLMAQRDIETATIHPPSTGPHMPELPCSSLASTLSTTAPQLVDIAAASAPSSSSPAVYLTPANVLNAQQTLRDGKGKLAIANFGMTSSRRGAIWEALCSEHSPAEYRDWLQCRGNSGELGDNLPAVYEQLSQYLFWLSPNGNGYDSHRTWEALYMGAVPVMERLPITRYLFDNSDLPVLLVDDMTRLTRDVLFAHAVRYMNMSRDYGRWKLHIDYWKRIIVGKQREYRAALRANDSTYMWDSMEGTRCWGARQP